MIAGLDVRAGERRIVAGAAILAALAGAGFAMVNSAADALFMARVGVRHLGTMLAVSSAVLVVVLGYVGALADRADRGRLLAGLAVTAALVIGGLGAAVDLAPAPVSAAALIMGKQLGAALDLAFWVFVAERFDARQGRRLVPLFVVAQGGGAVLGGFAVGPLAGATGAAGALLAAAAIYLLCAAAAANLARADAPRGMSQRPVGPAPRRTLSWSDGLTAATRSPLARRLALLVAVAGVFAPIVYYLLAASAAATYADEAAVAGFLGRYRAAVQLVILAAAFAAPTVLARVGVAPALMVAPIGAVAAAAALAVGGGLAVVAVAQASARLLDAVVQTPAEKLAQNLLPRQVRGRVHGFIDGVAKRAGAIIGGVSASLLVAWPHALAAVTVVAAVAWLVVAWRLRRCFAELAVAELVARPRSRADDDGAAAWVVDERALRRLRADLEGGGEARRLAMDLLGQLDERGRIDAVAELAIAARQVTGADRRELLRAIDRLTQRGPVRRIQPATGDALMAMLGDAVEQRAMLVAVLGRCDSSDGDIEEELSSLAEGPEEDRVRAAARMALARIRGDAATFEDLVGACLRSGNPAERTAAMTELRAELTRALAEVPPAMERALHSARTLLRALDREREAAGRAAGLLALADLVRAGGDVLRPVRPIRQAQGQGLDARATGALVLVRAEARALALRILEPSGDEGAEMAPPAVRAACVELLGALGNPVDAGLLAAALGDRDDRVRRAATDSLLELGDEALEALLVAASFGRRAARNAALEIVRDLRISNAAIDQLIARELTEIDETSSRLRALATLPDGARVVQRLEERIEEAAHTMLLALEAKLGEPAIGAAARQFLRARDDTARARALETLDTVLPRSLARQVLPPLDAGVLGERAARAAARLGREVPQLEDATTGELSGADPLARALVVYALGAGGRARYRTEITAAAALAARELDPMALLRRINSDDLDDDLDDHLGGREGAPAVTEPEDEMPRTIETVMALSQLPIFADLTTRQLSELAQVVKWEHVRAGQVVVAEGDLGDAMYFVLSGTAEVRVGADLVVDRLGAGDVFGEMALFEGDTRSATVVATQRARLGRIDSSDFEELVDDIPGIALAICRVLSRRVRAANARAA